MKAGLIVYALFTLLLFCPIGFGANITASFFCANTTTLNQTVNYFDVTGEFITGHETRSLPCAWGCIGGECLNGTDLALNAFLTLLVYWMAAFIFFWIGKQLDDGWQLTITVMNGAAIGMFIIGVIAVIMMYPPATGTMSAVVPSLYTGITDTFQFVILALAVMFVGLWVVRQYDWSRIKRGLP